MTTSPQIDKRLNIVLTVEDPSGKVLAHIHSTPISREIYEANFLLLFKTVQGLYAEGLSYVACCRIGMLMLRKVAADMDKALPKGAPPVHLPSVEANFLPEVWRLTNVRMPGDAGWQTFPMQHVIDKGLLDADDIAEVQNYLVFFTAACWVHPRADLSRQDEDQPGLYQIWRASGAQLTSQKFTDWVASSPTSKPPENTGANQTA